MNTSVNISKMILKNPVIAASGTFGFGREYSEYFDLSLLGGIAVKGLTLAPRAGNLPPRIAETPSGMLNSVGLQNPGIDEFILKELGFLKKYDTAVIANAAGASLEDYSKITERLNASDVDAIEINVSCPNVKQGCLTFGSTARGVSDVTRAARAATTKPLIIKLTPNVTDITEMARAAEDAGADAVSLINTLLGMAIDAERRKPILANVTGGLSGPAVKPIALRMVWDVAKTIKIPVIGMGGISNGTDAVEFLLAGASAIMMGTAGFTDPMAWVKTIDGITKYMARHNYNNILDLTGALDV